MDNNYPSPETTPQAVEIIYHPKPADFAPEPTFPNGTARCTAWSRRRGRQCNQHPVKGKTKCRHHGGATPSGIASANYKNGRYVKAMPVRLLDNYHASMEDSELLNLRAEISLLDARLHELLGKVDTGESGATWRKLQGKMKEYDDHILKAKYADGPNRNEYLTRAAMALNELRDLIENGLTDFAIWDEIKDQIRERRFLVESERKRLTDMQNMITGEQALALATALSIAVKTHVTDSDTLRKINSEFMGILHQDNSRNTRG